MRQSLWLGSHFLLRAHWILTATLVSSTWLTVAVAGEETSEIIQTGTYAGGKQPLHDAGVDGSGNGEPGATPLRLMMLDSGFQPDAGDLSNTAFSAGAPGAGHRKIHMYATTNQFGGSGDLAGCDATAGFTHGHLMAAIALGNATNVPVSYGPGWGLFADRRLDGVAPGARLVAYDADAGFCFDPMDDGLAPGDLYNPAPQTLGSLEQAATVQGARTFSFSWGAPANTYNANATDVDLFLQQFPDAALIQAVGNEGAGVGTVATPGTARNAIVVGATYNDDVGVCSLAPLVACETFPVDPVCPGPGTCIPLAGSGQMARWAGSSMGPAVSLAVNRIAPILMAPGADVPLGTDAQEPYACGTIDDDILDPVECTPVEGPQGTDVAAAAAAGAALLVRDYFQQGFHPDGFAVVANQEPGISGALVKAILVASAEWMGLPGSSDPGPNLTVGYRFNNQQGYGRIQLVNALKLHNWGPGAEGLIVHDGLAGAVNIGDLPLPASIAAAGSAAAPFVVVDDERELRIALAWTDPQNGSPALQRNLNLTLTSPSGINYRGNYFTDDNNRNGVPGAAEDCPPIGSALPNGTIDEGPWSLPVCALTMLPGPGNAPVPFDNTNVTEAIFLSPDPDGNGELRDGSCAAGSSNPDGIDGLGTCGHAIDCAADPLAPLAGDVCEGGTNQVEPGTWTVTIAAGTPFLAGAQDYSLAVAGGAVTSATVVWDDETFDCTEDLGLRVLEVFDAMDPVDASEVSDATTIQVLDPLTGDVLDEESGFVMLEPIPGILKFVSQAIPVLRGVTPTLYDGVIEAYDGQLLRALYDDSGSVKQATARFTCEVLGGRVWDDRDGDGLQDATEPSVGGVLVELLDGATGTVEDLTVTGANGTYQFELMPSPTQRLRFTAPPDWIFTIRDVGNDDSLDSDVNVLTGETVAIGPAFAFQDATRWDAGLRQLGVCIAPDESVYIYGMRRSTDGNDYAILDFQDPNQPSQVTGYNVYRSADADLDPELWPQVASDVADMDEATPNRQWVDQSDDVSPSGVWFYQIAAYNSICDAEGPR